MLTAVKNLKDYFKALPWYQQYFFPASLKTILLQANAANSTVTTLDIMQAALDPSWLSGTWFFHRFFFPGLKTFYATPAMQPCQELFKKGWLSEVVVEHDHSETIARQFLQMYEGFNQERQGPDAGAGAYDFAELNITINAPNNDLGKATRVNLSTGASATNIQKIKLIISSFQILEKNAAFLGSSGLQRMSYLTKIVQCDDLQQLSDLLTLLQGDGIIATGYPQAAANLARLFTNLAVIKCLSEAWQNLPGHHPTEQRDLASDQSYFDTFLNSNQPSQITEAIRILRKCKSSDLNIIMTHENVLAVMRHNKPQGVATALLALAELKIPIESVYLQKICAQPEPLNIAVILKKLEVISKKRDSDTKKLDAVVIFNSVIKFSSVLGGLQQVNDFWEDKSYTMKLSHWIEILMLCHEHEDSPDLAQQQWQLLATRLKRPRTESTVLNTAGDINKPALLKALVDAQENQLLINAPESFACLMNRLFHANAQLMAQLQQPEAIKIVNELSALVQRHILSIEQLNGLLDLMLDLNLFNNNSIQNMLALICFIKDRPQIDVLNLQTILQALKAAHPEVKDQIQVHFAALMNNFIQVSSIYLQMITPINLLSLNGAHRHLTEIYSRYDDRYLPAALSFVQTHHLSLLSSPAERATAVDDLLAQRRMKDFTEASDAWLSDRGTRNVEKSKIFFQILLKHPLPKDALEALNILDNAALLANVRTCNAYYGLVRAESEKPAELGQALVRLHHATLLPDNGHVQSQRIMELVSKHRHISEMAEAVIVMSNNGLLGPHIEHGENLNAVASSNSPMALAEALVSLKNSGLLSHVTRVAVTGASHPVEFVEQIIKLSDQGIVYEQNQQLLCAILLRANNSDDSDCYQALADELIGIKQDEHEEDNYDKILAMTGVLHNKQWRIGSSGTEYDLSFILRHKEHLCNVRAHAFFLQPPSEEALEHFLAGLEYLDPQQEGDHQGELYALIESTRMGWEDEFSKKLRVPALSMFAGNHNANNTLQLTEQPNPNSPGCIIS